MKSNHTLGFSKQSNLSIYQNFKNYETQRCSDIKEDNSNLGINSAMLLPKVSTLSKPLPLRNMKMHSSVSPIRLYRKTSQSHSNLNNHELRHFKA